MAEKIFVYRSKVNWKKEKIGILVFEEKPEIVFTIPKEFGGEENFLTPEDLFLASINACVLTSFLYFSKIFQLKILSYTSTAEGTIKKVGEPYVFTEVNIKPIIEVETKEEKEKAVKVMETAKKHCIVSKSVEGKVNVIIQPTIRIRGE